jgi:hypothetical protein
VLDYETIGQDIFTIPVVNCAYFIFDWDRFVSDNPYTFEELIKDIQFAKFNIYKQVKEDGYSFKKEDLKWWNDHLEKKKQLDIDGSEITIEEFTKKFYDYVYGHTIFRWWSRSNTFDPILLHRNFRDFSSRESLDFILPFWLVRDIRTYIDTQFQFKNKVNGFCPIDDIEEWKRKFIEHNPIHDIAADILRIQKIERSIHL